MASFVREPSAHLAFVLRNCDRVCNTWLATWKDLKQQKGSRDHAVSGIIGSN